jgi:two-component system, NarL family, sensor histidine kinase DesK
MPLRPGPTRARLLRLNLVTLLPPLGLVGVLLIVSDARAWWHVVILGLSLVAALVAIVRWTGDDVSRVALPCLLVTAAVWLLGALVTDWRSAFYGITIVGPLVIPQLPRHRVAAAVGLTAYVAAVGAARLLVSHEDGGRVLLVYVLIPAGVTVVAILGNVVGQVFYNMVSELEQSREREAELAVARERIRFASDLHDIQGHTLHVVKLKTLLARKLVRTDPGRAEDELREVHDLVGETIKQTKELAYAQRRLNLSAELENAKNLFEAADIDVRVDREAAVDAGAGELLGQVLRETTTNILRHAQATQVRITLSESGISIANNGAQEAPLPELSGLATLRERLAGNGGELTVAQQDGQFLTTAVLPRPERRENP